MNGPKYAFPDFLVGKCTPPVYANWLHQKAIAHRKRDIGRGNAAATNEGYKVAIHAAVVASSGVDAYTGRELRWDLLSTWDNEASKTGKQAYKQSFGDLPSVDHVGDGLGAPDFAICAWRTNDAKSDLSYHEFVELCRVVVAHHERGQI